MTRACDLAFPMPAELACGRSAKGRPESVVAWKARLGDALWQQAEAWLQSHRFSPNQLRHTAATMLRAKHGIDVA